MMGLVRMVIDRVYRLRCQNAIEPLSTFEPNPHWRSVANGNFGVNATVKGTVVIGDFLRYTCLTSVHSPQWALLPSTYTFSITVNYPSSTRRPI
jgi:hypothetical protein